jgi:hypothetical protein
MSRDYLAEALAIAEGRSMLRAERDHIDALYGVIRTMGPEQYRLILETHAYPTKIEDEAA